MDEGTKQLILDYQQTFGTEAGKRVLDDLATHLNYHTMFASIIGAGKPENTAFELGKREAFLSIIAKIGSDPNAVVQEVAETEESSAID